MTSGFHSPKSSSVSSVQTYRPFRSVLLFKPIQAIDPEPTIFLIVRFSSWLWMLARWPPLLWHSLSAVRAFMGFSIKSSLTNLATNAKKKEKKSKWKNYCQGRFERYNFFTTIFQKRVQEMHYKKNVLFWKTKEHYNYRTTWIRIPCYHKDPCTVYYYTKSTGLTYTCLYRNLYSLENPFQKLHSRPLMPCFHERCLPPEMLK